jgi:hypothetical protein
MRIRIREKDAGLGCIQVELFLEHGTRLQRCGKLMFSQHQRNVFIALLEGNDQLEEWRDYGENQPEEGRSKEEGQ